MTCSRINIFRVLASSRVRGTSFDIKIRNKFIEIKYSSPNRFIIFITVFKNKWFFGRFPSTWKKANIAFLELYPIVTATLVWGEAWKNHKIIFVTDNQALVAILNQKTSKLKPIMHLVRILVLHCLRFNIELKSRHIPDQLNCQADALSRLQVARFKELAPNSDRVPTEIPFSLLPENLCKDLKIC